MTRNLLLIQAGSFLLYAFADGPPWFADYLAASYAHTVDKLRVWQVLTAPWLHLETRSLIEDMLVLWLSGPALERWWGVRRYLFFLCCTGSGSIAIAIFSGLFFQSGPIYGGGGMSTGLLIALAIIFSTQKIHLYRLLAMRCRTVALWGASFFVVASLLASQWNMALMHLAGAVIALFLLGKPKQWLVALRLKQAKRRFRIVDGSGSSSGDRRWINRLPWQQLWPDSLIFH